MRSDSLLPWDDGYSPFVEQPPEPWLTMRHGRGINMLTLDTGVRGARTSDIMQKPMRRYYETCAMAGCTFCNELRLFHYSFARDRLFWWTGPTPTE